MDRLIRSAVNALAALAVCIFLPLAAVRNMWQISKLIGLTDVTPVLMQLKEAPLVPGYIPAAICAAAVFAVTYFMRRHRIIAGMIAFLLVIIGVLCALMTVKSNNIPFGTILQILVEYMRLGAF